MNRIKVFLIAGLEIFRSGLQEIIDDVPDMAVVGASGEGETALEQLRKMRPDVVVMEIGLPGINGLEMSRMLLNREPQVKILFFTLYDNPEEAARALDLGARGYIPKDAGKKILLAAIRVVHQGKFYFIGEVTDVLVRKYLDLQKERNTRDFASGAVALSRREEQILRMISKDLSNKEIAEVLRVSVRTIEAHRLNILRKCQAGNIEEVLTRLDLDIDSLSIEDPGKEPI